MKGPVSTVGLAIIPCSSSEIYNHGFTLNLGEIKVRQTIHFAHVINITVYIIFMALRHSAMIYGFCNDLQDNTSLRSIRIHLSPSTQMRVIVTTSRIFCNAQASRGIHICASIPHQTTIKLNIHICYKTTSSAK